MNNQNHDPKPDIKPPPRPQYQLAYLIAMLLERQAEATKASQAQRQEGKR